jgi:RNA-binding protein
MLYRIPMRLTNTQIKFLRGRCQELKPVVMLGQKGLSETVLNELDIALDHHELVKIKLSMDDRDDRKQVAEEICRRCDAESVQVIGKTLSIYRANNEKPVIALP